METGNWELVGSGKAMTRLRQQIARVAATSETVLVMGENGTGKELVARALHAMSERRNAAWITLNCPALNAQLMESELFGHRKGAFTGADYDRVGRFEMADGGTLLLDEISEIDVHLQSKLLRVLQERTFEQVGSCETKSVNVRVIATTNRDLNAEIAAGRFREDLYYRLAVLPIIVPPLRSRRDDVPELVTHFAAKAAGRLGREPLGLSDGAMNLMCEYPWPGNVRQLENVITRATIFADKETVDTDEIRSLLFEHSGMTTTPQHHQGAERFEEAGRRVAGCKAPLCRDRRNADCDDTEISVNRLVSARFSPGHGIVRWQEEREELAPAASLDEAALPFLGMTLGEMEEQLIRLTLERFHGHRAKTAAALGIGLRTLTTKIKELVSRE
ncbi:MAG: sigma-54 dependent transcriptional regulator [Planctomycetaceae bacterium]|nr:sigma-54 dependent transcriptional regulator [Planctomycetaceae bacterium]